jgi:alpha-1,2-mannosyltransferase
VFVEIPALVFGWLILNVLTTENHGWLSDFRIFRAAGRAVLFGHSPYVKPTVQLLASNDRFVYPTPFAFPFVPFAVMPERMAGLVFLVTSTVGVAVALRMLGVRDWRCFGAALLTIPVFGSLVLGTIGPLLLLLVAAAWRYRDRAVAGVLIAIAAAAKVFLWPMLIWLVATRRLRGSAAAGGTLAIILGLWAAVDFHGLREYPTTLRVLESVQRRRSYSAESLLSTVGAPLWSGRVLIGCLAAAGIAAIVLLARRSDGDRRAFGLAVVVALFATPVLWLHYLVLLFVPLALASPTLSRWWALPAALWVTPHPESSGIAWRILLVLGVLAAAAALSRPGPAASADPTPPTPRKPLQVKIAKQLGEGGVAL